MCVCVLCVFVVVWGFGAFFFLFACFVTGGERISLGNPLCQNRKKPSGKKNKKPTEFCGVLSLIFSLVFHLTCMKKVPIMANDTF